MKPLYRIFFLLLILINIFVSTWFVRHGDLQMTPDIARDIYILDEIRVKGVVLIGPRASGYMYHGPLWAYINFPAFAVSGGNPVGVAWFWVALAALVLVGYFIIAKKLFNEFAAWCFVLMSSLYFIYHDYQLLHPAGAFFVMPFAFFFLYRYAQTNHVRYLIWHILVAGAIVQFEIAVGIPFLIVCSLYVLYTIIRSRRWGHFFGYAFLAIPFSTWVIFDARHGFSITKAAFRQFGQADIHLSLWALIQNRFEVMTTGIEFLRYGIGYGSAYSFWIFLLFLMWAIKTDKKYRRVYLLFLYLYVAYFAMSLLNRFRLMPFYVYPIFPFVFLFFSSLVTRSDKKIRYPFLVVFLIIYITNAAGILHSISGWSTDFVGVSPYSWRALSDVARTVYRQPDSHFGYVVFSPDIVAYEPRYAMEYWRKTLGRQDVSIFEKKSVTYVVIAPRNGTYMTHEWIKMKLAITSEPVYTWTFPSGYTVQKYELTPQEIASAFDQGINPGLFYR